MKTRTLVALTVAAGCACAATANPENITLTGQMPISMDRVGHMYINLATGERAITPPSEFRGNGTPLWINEQNDQCGFNETYWYPAVNTANGTNNWWLDWGDIADNTVADVMTLIWVTDVPDPELDGVEGLEATFSLFDGLDQTTTASGIGSLITQVFTIPNLPGSDGNGATGGANLIWAITVDLAGSGNELNFGSTDIDGDSMADFGYGWQFATPKDANAHLAGMMLVTPPELSEVNSLGDPDNMGLSFDQNWDTTNPNYWFGGIDCSGGAGFNWSPFASYYLGLYAADDTGGPCNDADLVEPYGVLEFADVLAFLGAFSAMDPAADLVPEGGDGVWEFADVLYFLGEFSAGCP